MVKIGPAFFDYVSTEKNRPRSNNKFLDLSEILSVVPFFLLCLALGVIFFRLFYLQVIRGNYYKQLSNSNRTRTKIIQAPRGIIYDKNGKALVSNSQIFKIGDKKISREEALKVISKGGKVENYIQREYLYKDAFAHVIGYVGHISEDEAMLPKFSDYSSTDQVGRIGFEKAYEGELHGENGKDLIEVDAQGKEIRSLGQKEPIPGKNIRTTLDLELELAVHEAMKDVEKGAVVALDPKNGGILALYSKPSFNPNAFTIGLPESSDTIAKILTDSETQTLLDRAIGGVYPPGSTFKLITAVAALTDGAIKEDTLIEDTGILRVGDFSFGNWYFLQYGRTEGQINVVGAIKRSNDIFFYKAAEQTQIEKISSFASEFGLGEKFGIDIEGEQKGTVPSPSWKKKVIGEQWYLGDTYNYSIGQGYLLTTPLQVNMFTSVFANGGILYEPHLLQDQKPKIKKEKFIDKKYIDLVRQGMMESCEVGGVAWPFFQFKVQNSKLKVDGLDYIREASDSAETVRIKVGCKTGTAEVTDRDAKPHAWISVFAPFYNPEIVLTVLVENGGEGSSVAGPIAKKILQEYFERK